MPGIMSEGSAAREARHLRDPDHPRGGQSSSL
jgi:hypothetical protein